MFASPAQFALIGLDEAENEQEKKEWLVELIKLTDQDFGFDIAKWIEWLNLHPWGKPELDPKPTEESEMIESHSRP